MQLRLQNYSKSNACAPFYQHPSVSGEETRRIWMSRGEKKKYIYIYQLGVEASPEEWRLAHEAAHRVSQAAPQMSAPTHHPPSGSPLSLFQQSLPRRARLPAAAQFEDVK